MTEHPQDLEEVQRRLDEIQSRKRGNIRWKMSRHTAELAIEAIAGPQPNESNASYAGSAGTSKRRRRKRRKRLL
jgi:hypothetical protein